MRLKFVVVVCVLCLLTGLVLYSTSLLLDALKVMKTGDTTGHILVTLNRTLSPTNDLEKYDVAAFARREFPNIPTRNGEIIDAWGHPIKVFIKREGTNFFTLRIQSAGSDGVYNTKDDLVREGPLYDSPIRANPR